MSRFFLFTCICILFFSCKQNDQQLLIGKWQSDDVWYEYFEDNTYNSGRAIIKMVEKYKYTLDEKNKTLNMYTDNPSLTFYLQYQFVHNDTLILNNTMNKTPHYIPFYRVKKDSKAAQ